MPRDIGAISGRVRNFFPSYRVFIYGIEVTSLVSSVRLNWPVNSPQQMTIELSNVQEVFTVTKSDILTIAALKNNLVKGFLDTWAAYTSAILSEEQLRLIRTTAAVPDNQFGLYSGDILRYSAKLNLAGGPSAFHIPNIVAPLTATTAAAKNLVIPKKLAFAYTQVVMGVDSRPVPGEVFYRFPFYCGDTIFHFGDPVRVAARNPSDPRVWYWLHSGTITDTPIRETEDKQSIVTVVSEGVLKDLRNARVANMTGAIRTPTILTDPNNQELTSKPVNLTEEQLSVITSSVPFSNFLQGLTLFQIIELMIFGVNSVLDDLGQAVRNNTPAAVIAERFGVPVDVSKGTVTEADVRAYERKLRGLNLTGLSNFQRWRKNQGVQVRVLGGPITAGDQAIGAQLLNGLQDWQMLLDHRVSPNDVVSMLAPPVKQGAATSDTAGRETFDEARKRLSNSNKFISNDTLSDQSDTGPVDTEALLNAVRNEITEPNLSLEDVISRIGTDPERYPIRQRVMLLLPANLGPLLGRKVLELDMSGVPASQAEYFDRLSLLMQVINRIDFVMYDSPRGDIVVEMPLDDFEPRHFGGKGARAFNESPSSGNPASESYLAQLISIFRGDPNATTTLTPLRDRDYSTDFAVYITEQGGIDFNTSEQDMKTVWVSTPRFTDNVARDGSQQNRQVTTVLPNLVPLLGFRVEQGDPIGNIITDEAARLFNHIQLNKANADAVSIKLSGCFPNLAAWPNRPVYVESKVLIGATKSVGQSIVWQSDCSTEWNFFRVKLWDGRFYVDQFGTTRKLFTPFGGVNAKPFNLATLLGIEIAARKVKQVAAPGAGEFGVGDAIQSGINTLVGKPEGS